MLSSVISGVSFADELTDAQKAKLAALNNQPQQALDIYNKLLTNNKGNLSFRLERASTLMMLKKDKQAKADIQIVLEKLPKQPLANLLYAQILLDEQDFKAAQTAAQKVLNLIPKNLSATFILGVASLNLKNYHQAEKSLSLYVLEKPADLWAQGLLANVYLAQDKPEQVILSLEKITQEQRFRSPIIVLTLADAYLKNNNTEKSISLLKQAQAKLPANTDIKKRLIAVQLQSGNLASAVSELEQFSLSGQSNDQFNFLLIKLYIKQKQLDKATNKLTELLAKQPNNSELIKLDAIIEELKGNTEQAITKYQKIIEQDTNNLPARMSIAKLAVTQSNWSVAQKYFKEMIKINPKMVKAHLGLAGISNELNKPEESEKHFLDAIDLSKADISTQLSIAKLLNQNYLRDNQPIKILSLAIRLQNQHPLDSQIQSLLAQAQVLNNQLGQAEETLKKIISKDKNNVKQRVVLAKILSKNKERQQEALFLINDVLQIESNNLSYYSLKIYLLLQQSQYQKALEVAKDTQLRFPDSIDGKLFEVDIYRKQQQYKKAAKIAKIAHEQAPKSAAIMDTYGYMLVKDGQLEEGLKLIQQAFTLKPQDHDIQYHLAVAYNELGSTKQALENLKDIVNSKTPYSEQENANKLYKEIKQQLSKT
jgi:cellulose synthase operon protein C